MKQIPLTQAKIAIVDDSDYELVSRYKWFAVKNSRSENYYAVRRIDSNGKQTTVLMSRFILGLEAGDKREADHIYHHTLDNRRSNLRIVSHAENQHNQKLRMNMTSLFKGVCHQRNKWRAYIVVDGKQIHLGLFEVEIDAAMAYDQKAIELFGDFACLNFPDKKEVA